MTATLALLAATCFGMAQEDAFASWRALASQTGEDLAVLDRKLYLEMQVGAWKEARALLEKRKTIGEANSWSESCEGDLLYWEGRPEEAKRLYEKAASRTKDPVELADLASRSALAERESAYRNTVRLHSVVSRIVGGATILFLLLLPWILPALWKRKGPG